MAALEDGHWWYRGLRRLVVSMLDCIEDPSLSARSSDGALRLLDAGAGTGGMLRTFETAMRSRDRELALVAVDVSELACTTTRRRVGRAETHQASVLALPFDEGTFDVVLCLNVLEHGQVEPDIALAEIYRVLAPGGAAIVNVSAYQWLLSYHDEAVGQVRRFDRKGLSEALGRAQFRVERVSYWNSVLFPLMVLRRKMLPRGDGGSDVRPNGRFADVVGRWALLVEHALIVRGIDLPFGGAVIAVARRER